MPPVTCPDCGNPWPGMMSWNPCPSCGLTRDDLEDAAAFLEKYEKPAKSGKSAER